MLKRYPSKKPLGQRGVPIHLWDTKRFKDLFCSARGSEIPLGYSGTLSKAAIHFSQSMSSSKVALGAIRTPASCDVIATSGWITSGSV